MLTLFALLRRARTVRPLLWWVLALLVYVVAPIPQEWVLLLIVGLGVALTVTVRRLREATGQPSAPRVGCGISPNASRGR
ncbi:MAG: hypothetical protein ACRD0H_16750 [Actinomycetes bacterium]